MQPVGLSTLLAIGTVIGAVHADSTVTQTSTTTATNTVTRCHPTATSCPLTSGSSGVATALPTQANNTTATTPTSSSVGASPPAATGAAAGAAAPAGIVGAAVFVGLAAVL